VTYLATYPNFGCYYAFSQRFIRLSFHFATLQMLNGVLSKSLVYLILSTSGRLLSLICVSLIECLVLGLEQKDCLLQRTKVDLKERNHF
jgi:hypothetical protein